MIKAHSLIYSIYICLIVAVLCGGLLFYFNLYERLNQYYNLKEDLYLENLSAINRALLNIDNDFIVRNDIKNIESEIHSKNYGVLSLVNITSYSNKDTISSSYFTGLLGIDQACLYLCDFSEPLSIFGSVSLIGNQRLPQKKTKIINVINKENTFINQGEIQVSDNTLPLLNNSVREFFEQIKYPKSDFSVLTPYKDSLYINSFHNVIEPLHTTSQDLKSKSIKGNYIFISKDTINIDKSSYLEDVILVAPVIRIEDGFVGNLQAFASKTIEIGSNVMLNYPSFLCVKYDSIHNSNISIGDKFKLYGSIVLYGTPANKMSENIIEIGEHSLIVGDVYCSGTLMLKADVYGTVYTNRFTYKTSNSEYSNCISDIEINIQKKPKYYVSIPILNIVESDVKHEIIKKIL